MKVCPRCGYENPDDAQFCLKCHYPLIYTQQTIVTPQPRVCPRCGHQNPPNSFFCERCHYPLMENNTSGLIGNEKEVEIKKEKIDPVVFEYFLVASITYIVSLLAFQFFPIYMSLLNALATIFLSLSLNKVKVKRYYYLVNLSPLGLYLTTINSVYGPLIFSLSGVFISDLMRIFYLIEKEELFRVIYIIFLVGYLGGILFPPLYDMITVGYIVLLMESVRRIRENRKKKSDVVLLPS